MTFAHHRAKARAIIEASGENPVVVFLVLLGMGLLVLIAACVF